MRLRNRFDGAGGTARGGIDRQGPSPWCLVEALEEGHLARRTGQNHAPFGQQPPHLPRQEHLAP